MKRSVMMKRTALLALGAVLLAGCANRAAPVSAPAPGPVDEECPRKDGTACR